MGIEVSSRCRTGSFITWLQLSPPRQRMPRTFGGLAPDRLAIGRIRERARSIPRYPMKSIADQLPPEIAQQIHPDRRKNEAAYWAVRDQLLDQYRGQWIGFADGRVVASGTSPVSVFHAAESTGLHPFFICVGREEEPCRIRRARFLYDASYHG